MENYEEMGMTDSQWKDNLRTQYDDWEYVQELINNGDIEKANEKIEKIKSRLRKGIESK